MKISFSRKGFDSAAGGGPSPILPDGTLLSLPIPEPLGGGVPYDDLRGPSGRTYADVMRDLDIPVPAKGAHADPDLNWCLHARLPGWLPMFGQDNASQAHLDNEEFGVGDLFLFYGWFRHTESFHGRLQWRHPFQELHVIWGYMVAGQRWLLPDPLNVPEWAREHPHIIHAHRYGGNNVIWVAAPEAQRELDPSLPNCATLRWDEDLCLTAPKTTRSKWLLPGCFWPPPALSCNDPSRFSQEDDAVLLRTTPRGQEYVMTATAPIKRWVVEILRAGLRCEHA